MISQPQRQERKSDCPRAGSNVSGHEEEDTMPCARHFGLHRERDGEKASHSDAGQEAQQDVDPERRGGVHGRNESRSDWKNCYVERWHKNHLQPTVAVGKGTVQRAADEVTEEIDASWRLA